MDIGTIHIEIVILSWIITIIAAVAFNAVVFHSDKIQNSKWYEFLLSLIKALCNVNIYFIEACLIGFILGAVSKGKVAELASLAVDPILALLATFWISEWVKDLSSDNKAEGNYDKSSIILLDVMLAIFFIVNLIVK